MAPVSYFFIAALVISLSNVQGQDDTNIYDEMNRCINEHNIFAHCPDYNPMIPCLENLWTLNITDDSEQKALTESIDFYTQKRDECPGVTDKGKCVDEEVNSCLKKHYSVVDSWKNCKSLETAIQCIDVVVTACNDDYAVREKAFLIEGKRGYCDLSDAAKKCIDDVDNCSAMISWPDLSPNGDISTCDRLSSGYGCMDKVLSDSVCNSTDSIQTKVREQREYFDAVAQRCQLASGPCTKVAMRNCSTIVYDLNIYPCPTPQVEEVKKCLDELQPKCTTDYQKEELEWEWKITTRDCSYTIETTTTSTSA